jgi:hypothetical protein
MDSKLLLGMIVKTTLQNESSEQGTIHVPSEQKLL